MAHPALPKPARPPYSTPTFSGRGGWSIPFKVRYCITFTRGGIEGPPSDWTPWFTSNQFSNTVLTRFPVDPDSYGSRFPTASNPSVPTGINLYRQFECQGTNRIYQLPYPFLGTLVDAQPDQ